MCRDRHPEIFWKSGQIWQNDPSGKGEIWEFGFSQGPVGAGIHPGGFVLMSGPQKPNYFPIWAIWGVSSGQFSHSILLFGGSPWVPIGPYWPLWTLPTGTSDPPPHRTLHPERQRQPAFRPKLFVILAPLGWYATVGGHNPAPPGANRSQ